jgi:hypothetical protein
MNGGERHGDILLAHSEEVADRNDKGFDLAVLTSVISPILASEGSHTFCL